MSYNIVDTDLIEINSYLEIETHEIGNHKIIVIDNFLKNPEYLLSLMQRHPIEDYKVKGLDYGWWKHSLSPELKFTNIRNFINQVAKQFYGITHVENIYSDIEMQFNYIQGGKLVNHSDMVPHVDPAFIASSIFLSSEDDGGGGTAFYSHKKSNIDYEVSYIDDSFKETGHYWAIQETYKHLQDNDFKLVFDSRKLNSDDWEQKFLVKLKYNRLVMHPSYIFHSAYLEEGWFEKTPRVSLASFIK